MKRTMNYWLYYYINRHVGDFVLDINGVCPYYTTKNLTGSYYQNIDVPMTPVLVTINSNKSELYCVVVNGSWENEYPFEMSVSNFTADSGSGVRLSSDNIDASPILNDKSEFVSAFTPKVTTKSAESTLSFTLQPHSVVFVTLHGVSR
jgi:alpha-L-arabinofuranosidase